MNKDIEKLNEQLSLKVAAEVERRAHEWLVAAKGVDWTEKFESIMRENVELKARISALEAENERLARFVSLSNSQALDIKQLRAQIAEKDEALRFYGYEVWSESPKPRELPHYALIADRGAYARKALSSDGSALLTRVKKLEELRKAVVAAMIHNGWQKQPLRAMSFTTINHVIDTLEALDRDEVSK